MDDSFRCFLLPKLNETMAPVSTERRSRRFGSRYHDDSFDDHPWDPFWEYVLGDGEGVETQRSRKYFHHKQRDRTDNFLDQLFPVDGSSQVGVGLSRKQAPSTTSSVAAANSAKRSKFWRRKNRPRKSSSASWFDDDRNESSTARGAGVGRRSGSASGGLFKRSKPQTDPFGLMAAKGSFDSFIQHYYGSDVETSDEDMASKTQQRKEVTAKKNLAESRKSRDGLLPTFNWDGGNTEKKNRRFLGRKNPSESSMSTPISSLFSKPGSTAASASTLTTFMRSSATKSASLSSSKRSTQREHRLLKDRGEQNMSPLERFVETFDAFGDVTTSDEDEYSSSVSSDDVDDEEDEDDDEGSSSFDSSYASASYSYATEVTDEDTNYTSALSDNSRNETARSKSQGNLRYISPSRSRSQGASASLTRGGSMQRDVHEVRLKYSPAKSAKSVAPSSQERLLPPMIGDDDEESEPQYVGLAGDLLESRGGNDFPVLHSEEKSAGDEREDLTITTRDSLASESCSKVPLAEESRDSLPEILPKSIANSDRFQVNDDASALERSRTILSRNQSLVGKIVCCSVKDLDPAQERRHQEMGKAVLELTHEDLEEMFPKVRSISEDIPLSRHRSCVIGNSKSFEKDFPAHLQAIVKQNGPQSLYEYEYEKGTHKVLVYEDFGPDPRCSLRVHISEKPPMLFREGFQDENKVIVQVEVCCSRATIFRNTIDSAT